MADESVTYRLRANKFRLRPSLEQDRELARFVGAARFVYNVCLRDLLFASKRGHRISYPTHCRKLTQLRESYDWLAEAPAHTQQQAIKDAHRAYQNWRDPEHPAKRPTPRKKYRNDTIRFPVPPSTPIKRTGKSSGMVKLPKLGWIRFRGWYALQGEMRSVTVKRDGGHWVASVLCRSVAKPVAPSEKPDVGIDRGVTVFAALSTGELVEPLNAGKKALKALARAQRHLARKQRGSNRRKKQVARVAKIHARVRNARRDFLHKLSTRIAKNHGHIFVESLKTKNMTRSAKGTVHAPGRNVRAKSGLNRSILDQGWGMFGMFLSYKALGNGGSVHEVPAQNTSKLHHVCGFYGIRNGISFYCPNCEEHEHADVNAALNIRRLGRALLRADGGRRVPGEARTIQEAA